MGLTIFSFEITIKDNQHLSKTIAREIEQNDLHKMKGLLLDCMIWLHSFQLGAQNKMATHRIMNYLVLFYGAGHKMSSGIN